MRVQCLAIAAAMLMSSLASAAMVEMNFDVTLTEREVGELGSNLYVDESFIPQSFSITLRFDIDNSHTDSQFPWVRMFSSPSLSSSSYSQAYRDKVPAPIFTEVTSQRFEDGFDAKDIFSANNEAVAGGIVDGFGTYFHYGQYLQLSFLQELVSSNTPGGLAGSDLLSLLQFAVGQTFARGYQESYFVVTSSGLMDESGALNYVAYDGQFLTGDLTLRSVQVVPLPAVGLWMQLGAVGAIAWAARRRQRARA